MDCVQCLNCKAEKVAYFCPAKNEFVVNEVLTCKAIEKVRSGWKKGDPDYEMHRRKTRTEVEVVD